MKTFSTFINESSFDRKIEQMHDAFDHYGYIVTSTPIEGQEEVYYKSLLAGLRKIETHMDLMSKGPGRVRGTSKRALMLLHARLPEPAWGVEVNISKKGL
jgi:hypothetical protein